VTAMDYGKWEDLFKAAMLELDPVQLRKKIEAARTAIRRQSEQVRDPNGSSIDEVRAMSDALQSLRVLEKTELNSPSEANQRPSQPIAGRDAL
jgi:hypothetical protein